MTIHYVYGLTFSNGKKYIGIARNVDARWRMHCYRARHGCTEPLYNAIRKYGLASIERTIMGRGSRSYVRWLERTLISAARTIVPCGYNLLPGGDESPALLASVRQKIRESKLRHWQDPAYRKHMVEVHTGRTMTAAQNRRNAEAKKRHWQDPKYRARLVAAHTGKKDTSETKRRKSEAQMGHANRNHLTPVRNEKGQWQGWTK
jgi:hypothetical protein